MLIDRLLARGAARATRGRRRLLRDAGRGAVALEFALVLPLLVTLLLGVITTGLAYNDKLSISNAAREGGRFGSAVDYSTGATAWATSVQTRVRDTYFNAGSTLTTAQVCVVLRDSTGTSLAATSPNACGTEPDAPAGMVTGSCVVKVWVQKPARIDLGLVSIGPFNIAARSVSYYGRSAGTCTAS